MLAFILVLYCCILWKACYMWEIKDGREPHWNERKEMCGQRPRKAKKIKKSKAEGLKRRKKMKAQSAWVCQRHKSEKKKMREAQSAWKKKERCSMLCGNWIYCIASICGSYLFILLVIDYYPSFIIHISLPCNPQSPLDLIVPCILMGGELRTITSLWWGGMHWAKEWSQRP